MPKRSSRGQLEEAALDLAWGLWTEAGVAGTVPRLATYAIDPEALIILTAHLRDADPRLGDEATDWCIRYGRYISAARLRNLLETFEEPVRMAFGEFAATVNEHANHRWPHATRPRKYRPTRRSRLDDFSRPALVALRTRALFGVGARAEIARLLLARPHGESTAAELASDACYTKRNVAEELEAMRLGGLLDVVVAGNQHRYRLARRAGLADFVGALPTVFPRWPEVVRVLVGALLLARRLPRISQRARLVEVDAFLRSRAADLRRAAVAPPPTTSPQQLVPMYDRWAAETFRRLADGIPPADADQTSAPS